ncbi:hypothetical protein SISNIDRAFT_468216 [Sistotremastrum niveocremeum HHB9708]|uniref:Uncharacterized protein n=1 Tax=Sistotremastrum niveocremeum HHB9708 TaxID=1314777 RepID=A0A164RXU2_9AGAM|nr:hypothetical protein SISNIDRAFT_468216 [Sistotremastrum niveocremeum HHB9708]
MKTEYFSSIVAGRRVTGLEHSRISDARPSDTKTHFIPKSHHGAEQVLAQVRCYTRPLRPGSIAIFVNVRGDVSNLKGGGRGLKLLKASEGFPLLVPSRSCTENRFSRSEGTGQIIGRHEHNLQANSPLTLTCAPNTRRKSQDEIRRRRRTNTPPPPPPREKAPPTGPRVVGDGRLSYSAMSIHNVILPESVLQQLVLHVMRAFGGLGIHTGYLGAVIAAIQNGNIHAPVDEAISDLNPPPYHSLPGHRADDLAPPSYESIFGSGAPPSYESIFGTTEGGTERGMGEERIIEEGPADTARSEGDVGADPHVVGAAVSYTREYVVTFSF